MNIKKRIVPLFLIILLIVSMFPMIPFAPYSVSATGGAWWNYSWNKRILVTINSSQINGSVTNFVALVKLNNATAAKCDGGKSIRFTDYEGTKTYAYDIDQFAGVNNSPETDIWVNISDTIPTGSNFTFYMYYNNSGAAKGENRATCWQEYSVVFHMGGQGLVTPVPINSSCINPESGKAEVGNLSSNPYRAPGIVGWGTDGGTGLRFTLATTTGHYTKYQGNNDITLFFNIYDKAPTTTQGVMGIFDKSNFDVYIQSSKMALYTSKGAVGQQVFINPWNQANVYHMIAGRYCYNTNLSIWDNGAQKDVVAAAGPFDDWASTNDVHWNNAMIGSGYNGYMDEFRLSWRMLSDAYIKMTYRNQYAYSGFLYLGAEEAVSAPGGVTLSTPLPSDSATNIPVWQSTLKVNVNSMTGNQSTVWIHCATAGLNVNSNSTGSNRTCTATIPRLHYATTYTWLVNASTANKVGTKFYSNTSYKFTTRTNIVPTIANLIPVNKSKGNLPGTMTLKFTIIDKLGDAMNWVMNLSNGARWSSNGSYNSTWQKSTTVLPSTNYTWWMNVSDANSTARYKMWFVTGLASSVVISNVQPANQSIDNKIWSSSLSLLVNKTGVPPTPPIRVRILCPTLGINATSWGQNRTVSVSFPRLNYSTTYIWTAKATVNGTSKKLWDNESYYFTTRANVVPTISNPYFANGTSNVNLFTNQILHADINDLLGDSLTWSIHCSNGASASGTSYNATVSCPLGNLKASTSYNWWVNISDANSSIHYKYLFTTRAAGVSLNTEQPTNGSSGINVWLSSLNINAASSYGNQSTVWIHCTVLNINANSTGTNRTCTAAISQRLHYSTMYHWTVTAYSDIYRKRYWTNESLVYFTTRANVIPIISSMAPANHSQQWIITANLSAYISDALGDSLSWTLEINHTTFSGTRYNGTIARTVSLQSSHNYTWWVNVSDINTTVKRKLWFVTTDSDKPMIYDAKMNQSTLCYGIFLTANQTATFGLFNISDTNPIYYDIMVNITTSAGDHLNFMTHNPTATWSHLINLSNGLNIIRTKLTDHYGNVAWKNISFTINIYRMQLIEAETGKLLLFGRFHYQNPWSILNVSLPELFGTTPPNHNITGYDWYWDFLVQGNNGWEYPWAWPGRGGGALRYGPTGSMNFTVVYPETSATFPPTNTLHPYSLRFNIRFWASESDPVGTLLTCYLDPTLINDYDPTWTPNATIKITIPSLGRPSTDRDGTNDYYSWGTSGAVTWPATGKTFPQGPFYEQDITSTQEKPFGVWSMNAQAWNLLDYTKFITGTTTSYGQAVYTIPGLYYFKIYKNGVPIILTTIDGGKASTIDLDLLEKSTAQMPVIQGTLGVQKLSNHSLLIYFHNVDRLVSETQIKIYNATHIFLWYNETNNPNEFYVYFDWTTTPSVNINESITVEAIPGGQSPISTTFIISGMIGPSTPGEAIPPEMVMIVCIALLLFGLTLFSVGATVSFFGPVTCGISLALTAMATQIWYIHMLQFMLIFFIAFMIIVFRYEYTTDRSVQ
ncbi:MAG: DUF2341 domain-containing protein [candidate division Zixibacteria bacterium]|nr:DUF2341 domain-containing protein [candidate division Zixibacteria bacterium]